MRIYTALLALIFFIGCEPQEQVEANKPPPIPIVGLKQYALGEPMQKYIDMGGRCGDLKNYTTEAQVCVFKDTFVHQDSEFWLYFVDGVMARVEMRPSSLMTSTDISRIQSALFEKYGRDEESYGFLEWESEGRALDMRIRPPKAGWVWATDEALYDKFESYEIQAAKDDI